MAPPPQILQAISGTSHKHYFLYGFTALLALGLVRYIYQTLTSPLRDVPGPFLARFTRLWEIWAIRKYENASLNIALHEKLGPVVRLAPNRYSINDGEAAKLILGHHKAMDKTAFYYVFGPHFEYNIFTEPSVEAHAKLKRPMAQLYSVSSLISYEPFVDTCNFILLKRLEEYAREGKTLDVREMMQFYAFDVIGEITCGSRFGLMEDDGDKVGIIEAIDGNTQYSAIMGLTPEWHWWIAEISGKLGLKSDVQKIVDFVNLHIDNRLMGRSKARAGSSDFLDKMLPMEKEGKLTRQHTFQAAGQNIAAGSDTTAISLTSALTHLSLYPETLATLRRELDEATAAGTLSDPATFKEAQRLPYLQAVIMEALRLHPAVGAPLVRVVGPQGLQIAGQFFPPGTEVGVNPWVIHRNKSIFGPDADVFRPERWLTTDKEERLMLERNFLAFGGGPRTCIGRNISMLEMSKVIPQVVKKFDFEIVQNEKGEKYTWDTRWFAKPNVFAKVSTRRKDE